MTSTKNLLILKFLQVTSLSNEVDFAWGLWQSWNPVELIEQSTVMFGFKGYFWKWQEVERGALRLTSTWLSRQARQLVGHYSHKGRQIVNFWALDSSNMPVFFRWSRLRQSLWSSTWGSSLLKTHRLTWPTSTMTCRPPRHWSSFSARGPIPWGPSSASPKRGAVWTGTIRAGGCN